MDNSLTTTYAERFEHIKSRFKLKNKDLAQMAGVSDNAISKLMAGITETPDVRTLIALGKKLNLSADWLLFGEGPMIKEEAVDSSLKKGLQLRDEMISQLQKELWGKLEGAIIDGPLSTTAFDAMMKTYRSNFFGRFGKASLLAPEVAKLVAPRSHY